jgi:hypothetical protein
MAASLGTIWGKLGFSYLFDQGKQITECVGVRLLNINKGKTPEGGGLLESM